MVTRGRCPKSKGRGRDRGPSSPLQQDHSLLESAEGREETPHSSTSIPSQNGMDMGCQNSVNRGRGRPSSLFQKDQSLFENRERREETPHSSASIPSQSGDFRMDMGCQNSVNRGRGRPSSLFQKDQSLFDNRERREETPHSSASIRSQSGDFRVDMRGQNSARRGRGRPSSLLQRGPSLFESRERREEEPHSNISIPSHRVEIRCQSSVGRGRDKLKSREMWEKEPDNGSVSTYPSSQPGRRGPSQGTNQPLDPKDRIFIRVLGESFDPHTVVSEISASVRYHLHGPWPSWSHYSEQMKKLLWELFKSKYTWAVGTTIEVYDTWWKVAHRRLRDMLSKERYKAELKTKSTKPSDWKGNGPSWIGESIWNKLCDDYWDKDSFKVMSKAGKKNRMTSIDGTISTHTGGSKPFEGHKEDMEKEFDGPVDLIELYDRTHRTKKGVGDYSCKKAKIVRDSYDNMVSQRHSSNLSFKPAFDKASWCEATGGISKGRVYGFGSQHPSNIFGDIIGSGGSKSKIREAAIFVSQESNERINLLEKTMEQLQGRNQQLQQQQEAIVAALEPFLPEAVRKLLQEIQWTNHNHPSGSGHQQQEFFSHFEESGRQDRSGVDSNKDGSGCTRSGRDDEEENDCEHERV